MKGIKGNFPFAEEEKQNRLLRRHNSRKFKRRVVNIVKCIQTNRIKTKKRFLDVPGRFYI